MARAIDTSTLPEDTIREALEFISGALRPADLAEVQATVGADQDPFWALFESWGNSAASWLIVDDTGLPIGIFGVAAHLVPKLGIAWLLGTEGIERDAMSVAAQTRQYIGELHKLFPTLWANVDARNELSMNWLTWAGFTVSDANPNYGPEGRLFVEFIRTV